MTTKLHSLRHSSWARVVLVQDIFIDQLEQAGAVLELVLKLNNT